MGFLKKNLHFFKITKNGKFAVECVSNDNNSYKCLFSPSFEVFSAKSQKNFQVGKNRKYDEEGVFFRKIL